MILRIALAAAAAASLNACSGSASPAPKNWSPIAGAANAWTRGTGSRTQEYRYATSPFRGSLQDLASQVTIDALTTSHGAKLQSSIPFPPCPGEAGVAVFRLAGAKRLEAGFALRRGQAVRVWYTRPADQPVDPSALDAMRGALCVLPA